MQNNTFKTVEVPLAGTQYQDPTGLMALSRGWYQHPLIKLVNEPIAQDPYAVKAYWNTYCVGYLPAKGRTCIHCLGKINKKDYYCTACGSQHFVNKGLNYQFCLTTDFIAYHCLITKVELEKRYTPIKVYLSWITHHQAER